MNRRFVTIGIGILCVTAAHQLAVDRAGAEWDDASQGQILGGAFAPGGPWIAFIASGEAWSITPNAGWVRREDFDLPVPSSQVKFLDSNGELFVLVTTTDEVWELEDNGLGWFPLDPFPGGPVGVESDSAGSVKGRYRPR